MKIGDRVVVTDTSESPDFFIVGDKATLTKKDEDGDWWADFDERQWDDDDKEFCLQEGITIFSLLDQEATK